MINDREAAIKAGQLTVPHVLDVPELRAMARKHGNPDQIRRLDSGVLPESEAMKILKDGIFKGALHWRVFTHTASQCECGHEGCRYKFTIEDRTPLGTIKFARMLDLTRKLEHCMVFSRKRTGVSPCGSEVKIKTAVAQREIGGITFKKEFYI